MKYIKAYLLRIQDSHLSFVFEPFLKYFTLLLNFFKLQNY